MKKVKILGVHGLGDHRNSTWKEDWTAALRAVFPGQQAVEGRERIELEFAFVTYDDIFEKRGPLGLGDDAGGVEAGAQRSHHGARAPSRRGR